MGIIVITLCLLLSISELLVGNYIGSIVALSPILFILIIVCKVIIALYIDSKRR